MRRREFIFMLSGAFGGSILIAGRASGAHPRIAILTLASSDDPVAASRHLSRAYGSLDMWTGKPSKSTFDMPTAMLSG
jgi:hypothetical protein